MPPFIHTLCYHYTSTTSPLIRVRVELWYACGHNDNIAEQFLIHHHHHHYYRRAPSRSLYVQTAGYTHPPPTFPRSDWLDKLLDFFGFRHMIDKQTLLAIVGVGGLVLFIILICCCVCCCCRKKEKKTRKPAQRYPHHSRGWVAAIGLPSIYIP